MFEEPNMYMYDAIQQLYIQKIVHESIGKTTSDSIDGDGMYSEALEAIGMCSPTVETWYNEDYDSVLYKITFEKMHEFFELCRKQAAQQKISIKSHPLVIKTYKEIDKRMYYTNSYCISWNLYVPQKLNKKKCYCLLFELSCEYYNYVELVDCLYSIRDYFINAEKELREELEPPKIIKMPKKRKAKTRRAA